MRLHHRIVIPFVLVALIATSAVAYVALSVITRALQSRVQAQILSASEVVSQTGFALNETILRSARAITGAEVVTFTVQGDILAATVDRRMPPEWLAAIVTPDAAREALSAGGPTPIKQMSCGAPCLVVYRPVVATPGTVVALAAETSELAAATGTIARTILVATALSLVVMLLVSQTVARRVTRPIEELVTFTRDVSAGDSRRRARAGEDEVGRLASAFNEMLDRLEASRDALVKTEKLGLAGLLAARVAHDIRNPLSSIKMQAQLLNARLPAQERGGALDAILHDIAKVEWVVQDLLELARPGELRVRWQSINIIVRDTLQQLSPQLAYRKIRTQLALDDGLPAMPMDAERFKLALVNIIVNAADAMPRGGVLEVSTRRARGASTMQLEVCDDGTGIDPSLVDRLFNPFVSTKRDGVGLGLVNAKAVVEAHGGTIGLAPRDPRGTRVTISLPIQEGGHQEAHG
jgi:signal transduction histidine kinase